MSDSAEMFSASDPAIGETVWSGRTAGAQEIDRVVAMARDAFEDWSATAFSDRAAYLQRFATEVQSHRAALVEAICKSTGKPRWEASTEVDAVVGKVALTLQAYRERRAEVVKTTADTTSATRYKSHGVLAVFGPFNFPAHLP